MTEGLCILPCDSCHAAWRQHSVDMRDGRLMLPSNAALQIPPSAKSVKPCSQRTRPSCLPNCLLTSLLVRRSFLVPHPCSHELSCSAQVNTAWINCI